MQRLPPSLADRLKPAQRACSLDGDADRLMYYYLDEHGHFRMLDGDKIAALVAAFIVDLVKLANLSSKISVGVVQTAYANGASTKYLAEVRASSIYLTIGLKPLHTALACEVRSYRRKTSSPCCRAL